jgi:hypothetical protein
MPPPARLSRSAMPTPRHSKRWTPGMDSHVVFWSDGSVLSSDLGTLCQHLQRRPLPVHQGRPDGSRQWHPIPDADPATFQLLRGAYARDDRRVFYFADQIVDADLASSRVLGGQYTQTSPDTCTGWERPSTAQPEHLPHPERRRRVLSRRHARLLPPIRHRHCRAGDVSAGPGVANCAETSIYRSRNRSYGSHFHDWATCPKDGTQPYPHVRNVLLGTVPNAAL